MPSAASLLWDLRRFGLTPGELLARVVPTQRSRVVAISIPKAGTHLLERVLCQIPGLHRPLLPTVHADNIDYLGGMPRLLGRLRPGAVLFTHLHWSTLAAAAIEAADAKRVFLIRDPRAIVVSQAAYIATQPRHPQYTLFAALPDLRARVLMAIRGNPATNFLSVAERLSAFAGWLDGGACVLRFEDLVGERGGGSTSRQREAVEGMLSALDIAVPSGGLDAILASAFSAASPTFRRGSIDAWRDVFDADVTRAFEEGAGVEAARYGYAETAQNQPLRSVPAA